MPVFVLVGVILATVVLALYQMSQAVNRIEAEHAIRTVDRSVASFLERLQVAQRDYAIWDDAVRNLYGTPDPQFVDENFRDSTESAELFDTAFLLDEKGRTLLAFRNGEAAPLDAESVLGTSLALVMNGVSFVNNDVAPRIFYVASPWGMLGVAAGPVLPYDPSVPLPAGEGRVLVIGKTLTDAAIADLGRRYAVDGLHKGPVPEDGRPHVVVRDPFNKPLAFLHWPSRDPGAQAFREAGLLTLAVAVILVVLVGVLVHAIGRTLITIRRGEERARHAALHDPLTGLPNRAAFHAALETRGDGTGPGEPMAVLFVDLDGFKEVNDTYGHEVGDRLLNLVAERFVSIVGDAGLLARLGGDEFAVILTGESAGSRGESLADRMIVFLREPIAFEGRVIQVGASVGIAVCDTGHLATSELVRRADVAMYAAKERGKNRLEPYRDDLDAQRSERANLARALRESLETEGFDVVYQPVVDARSGAITSVEALLRWTRPGVGPVPPSQFIPIAEETGLIGRIGEWVLRRACRDAARWPGLKVSVNVSPAQFRDPAFDKQIGRILAEEGFDPRRLELEITETYLVAHPDRAQRTIEAIRALGVSVALDDFGTGFSSIGYLRRFAFDKLKLDRSLVVNVATSEASQKLVHATVAIADALGIRVTAEGIEDEDEALLLKIAGCQELQGFHFARPKPAQDIDDLLRTGGVNALIA